MREIIVAVTMIIVQIEARPNGAPKGICKSQDFTPQHAPNQASGSIPYVVNVSEITAAGYIPGKKYNSEQFYFRIITILTSNTSLLLANQLYYLPGKL